MKITLREKTYLCIPARISGNRFVLTRFAASKASPGWLVKGYEIQEWKVTGFSELEGRILLYGPYHEGVYLKDILTYRPEQALSYLLRLVEALSRLPGAGIPFFRLQTDSVYFLRSGGVLFFPPETMKIVRETSPLEHRLAVFESINHPDLPEDSEDQLSFSLSALLYKILNGDFPFQADTEEEIHNIMRHLRIPPLSLKIPELKNEAADTIDRCLGKDREKCLSLDEWRASITLWKQEGIFKSAADSEKKDIMQQEWEKRQKRAVLSYRRTVFLQKYTRTLVLTLIALILAGAAAGSMLKNILKPRSTSGYPPLKVVETFYRSINSLEVERMEDCTAGKAGKQTINEVIRVLVLSRVSMGYEGKSHLLPADLWEQRGRPVLEPPETVFGIIGLEIKTEAMEPWPVFLASYEKWMPGAPDETESFAPGPAPTYLGFLITERLTLKKIKKYWLITEIERLQFEPLRREPGP